MVKRSDQESNLDIQKDRGLEPRAVPLCHLSNKRLNQDLNLDAENGRDFQSRAIPLCDSGMGLINY